MATTAMNTVFTSQRIAPGTVGPTREPIWNKGADRLENSLTKLVVTHSVGNHTGVAELMSALVLKAPVTIQYRGKANRIARIIRIMSDIIL
jgi:hypothetical protein